MSIYQDNPDAAPDSDFENGELRHLVSGNSGRLLDARRTPIRIVEIKFGTGMFLLEILDFEDQGAVWAMPFEEVERFQFHLASTVASDAQLQCILDAVEKFDRPLMIDCDEASRQLYAAELVEQRKEAKEWLAANSTFFRTGRQSHDPNTREGEPLLFLELKEFMRLKGLEAIEQEFAAQFVSNPFSGELVKGHRITLAKMGLVSYVGKVVRDPGIFEAPWNEVSRRAHILARLAFVHEMFSAMGCRTVVLYRGISTEASLDEHSNNSFVSTTFNREVAMSHFDAGAVERTAALYRQAVPIERLFMTYLETQQMNGSFKEAEAILLYDPENLAF